MPTAADYRDAARRLRTQATSLHHAADSVPVSGPHLLGPAAERHTAAMAALRFRLGRAVDELAELAGVCDRRATVCAEYAAALRRYERLEWWQRLLTGPPARPARWADA